MGGVWLREFPTIVISVTSKKFWYFGKVVAYRWWLLKRGDCLGRFDCNYFYIVTFFIQFLMLLGTKMAKFSFHLELVDKKFVSQRKSFYIV